jgi:hypothetical protein
VPLLLSAGVPTEQNARGASRRKQCLLIGSTGQVSPLLTRLAFPLLSLGCSTGVEERIADWTMLPVENGEGLQVLRYRHGQKYDAHWDYFFDSASVKNGGNRYATVLMYLADVEEGGETAFPKIPAPGGDNPGFSDCAARHLAAKPRIGDGEWADCSMGGCCRQGDSTRVMNACVVWCCLMMQAGGGQGNA